MLALCATASSIQLGYWKNSETLFRHALNVIRDNPLAHNNLGTALYQEGRTEDAAAEFTDAEAAAAAGDEPADAVSAESEAAAGDDHATDE